MSESTAKTPLLGDRSYQVLKQTATLVLPAIGAMYFTLAQIWHLPKAEEVVGTIASVNTFVGVLVGVSTRSYNNSGVAFDGTIKLDKGRMASVEIHHDSEQVVVNKGLGLFKIE